MSRVYIQTHPKILGAPWFSYTLDLIGKIAGLAAPIQAGTHASPDAEAVTLCYGTEASAFFIPAKTGIGNGEMIPHDFDCGPAGQVSVPIYTETVDGSSGTVDLLYNFFAYVSCLEEFEHEKSRGPIQSYAFRLKGNTARFERPFAQYLGLAFRRLLEKHNPKLLDPLNSRSTIYLTHDVDVIGKTMRTRLKESAFRLYSGLRSGRFAAKWILTMLLGADDYFLFDKIAKIEERHGIRSSFNIFIQPTHKGIGERLRSMIFDPSYDLADIKDLIPVLRGLHAQGFEIGAHFAFDSWQNSHRMGQEKRKLQDLLDCGRVVSCRQHWLRFSLAETWAAQWQSGIEVDTTLCFNDLPGFRAGLAMPFHPYDHINQRRHHILAIPTIVMDSHLHYYQSMNLEQRRESLRSLLDEVRAVGGSAAMIWHSHVFSQDHGWETDYLYVLSLLREMGIHSGLPRDLCDRKAGGA
ncbi:MAG: hypothetical protein HOL66_10395 [Rhodospirillaceae bacterium]|nr:hypothetical protein [Rhodospirillaceae bacterium]MBT5563557.1 hypothetical protein [Rhodospirillaceae bacterium]MBT7137718.1 hypothetical protein [Rhodospirillaceae bacterium]